jgi:hypothetical protein
MMNHQHPYAKHPSFSRTDTAPSSNDAEAERSAEIGDTREAPQLDTDWDNWKSVRDVA